MYRHFVAFKFVEPLKEQGLEPVSWKKKLLPNVNHLQFSGWAKKNQISFKTRQQNNEKNTWRKISTTVKKGLARTYTARQGRILDSVILENAQATLQMQSTVKFIYTETKGEMYLLDSTSLIQQSWVRGTTRSQVLSLCPPLPNSTKGSIWNWKKGLGSLCPR